MHRKHIWDVVNLTFVVTVALSGSISLSSLARTAPGQSWDTLATIRYVNILMS